MGYVFLRTMQITVHPGKIHGSVYANASKSYTQRLYALAALADGPSVISNPSWSDDGCAALAIARNLGADINVTDREVQLRPGQHSIGLKLECP